MEDINKEPRFNFLKYLNDKTEKITNQRIYNICTMVSPETITKEDFRVMMAQVKIVNAITDIQVACADCPKNPSNGGDGNCCCVLGKPIAKKEEGLRHESV